IDIKALQGDTSDNIPGVPGVGEKTAVKLITEYGSLENLYQNIEQIKGALREKLSKGREPAFLSRTLGTIRTDPPVVLDLEACRPAPLDRQGLVELFTELELRQFLGRPELKEVLSAQTLPDTGSTGTVLDEAGLAELSKRLAAAPGVALAAHTLG